MHYKQNNKESKTYVQGLRRFVNTLPRGIKGILKKRGYNYSEIVSKWNLIMGNEIANSAFPKSIKMKKGNTNATLVLNIKRGDEINIEFSKREIINKVNSYFGYKLINEIRLQAINSELIKDKNKNTLNKLSENYENKIKKIENENIKDSLLKYLKTIKND